MAKRHLMSLKRCCCVFAMKKAGLRETAARPGRLKLDADKRGPCWDRIAAWNTFVHVENHGFNHGISMRITRVV